VQAITILRNDQHKRAYNLFHIHEEDINLGAVWADQDLKSSNHFYNPDQDKGLYGRSNAYKEYMSYYKKALVLFKEGDIRGAMFFLGAACHLIQDVTVPQHVNVRLLGQHKKYENWVKRMYLEHEHFSIFSEGIYLEAASDYIYHNSKCAMEIYNRHRFEVEQEKRFHDITQEILILAQKTTAGLLMNFYNDIEKL
jgi:phospholipase C